MKNIITIVFLIISFYSCKAQNIILPLGSPDFHMNPNYYLKDINNNLDKFVGVWKYQNGNEQLILDIRKEVHYLLDNNGPYEDLLVGEYKYIDADGVLRVDTLYKFNDTTIKGDGHTIVGSFYHYNEGWVRLLIGDPIDQYAGGNLKISYFNDVEETITVVVQDESTLVNNNVRISIPDGTYTLFKQ